MRSHFKENVAHHVYNSLVIADDNLADPHAFYDHYGMRQMNYQEMFSMC